VINPKSQEAWSNMFQALKENNFSSTIFQNIIFKFQWRNTDIPDKKNRAVFAHHDCIKEDT
jgi:hypothetical protein